MSTWVVTPCHRGRLGELRELLDSLGHDPARVVVVTTMPDPIGPDDLVGYAGHLCVYTKPGMLFGRWIDLAFNYIAGRVTAPHEVLVMGSSLRGTPATVPALSLALRENRLMMVGPDLFGRLSGGQVEEHRDDERTLWNRIPGICFMVPGELGLRFDPQFRWWFGEDDLEMQARQHGPVGLVGGCGVTQTAPNGHPLNDEQAQHAVEDREKFIAKWGQEPW